MPGNTAVQVSLKVGGVVQRTVVECRHLWARPNIVRSVQHMGKQGGTGATASANEVEIKRMFHNARPGFASSYRSRVRVLDADL